MENLGLTMNEFTFWFGINAVINIAAFTAPKFMDRFGTYKKHWLLVFQRLA